MWRRTYLEWTGTVVVLGLILCKLLAVVSPGSVVIVQCVPGQRAALPCPYHYEEHFPVPELSVQWRSPNNQLLCHYIKHKSYQNCSSGYTIVYVPGTIRLVVQQLDLDDFGVHVCSVGKKHEFSDYSIEVVGVSESGVSEAKCAGNLLGGTSSLVLLHLWIFKVMT